MKTLISKKTTLKKIRNLTLKVIICFILGFFLPCHTLSQNLTSSTQNHIKNSIPALLLSADELIYNHDSDTVYAQGNVKVEYDGNIVIAKKLIYNKRTGRIIAQGNVEIIQKDGNKIYSNQIDMTKDFGEGFINFLRIDTENNIHFMAANATQSGNNITIFDHAVYTACSSCSDEKVLWKIKARKIIWNRNIKKIRFENSYFELFGIPIVKLSNFELYDPTVKRASGFLAPRFFYADHLGVGVKNSYFWNLTPYYDLTFSVTAYTQRGLLTEGEWRQRFETGDYNIRFAHIYQTKPYNFDNDTIDFQHTNRYMLATKGDFHINPRWSYGWNVLAQSDQGFSYTYRLENYSDPVQNSQFYLIGLSGQNHFDMHFYHFKIQDPILNDPHHERYPRQPWIIPRLDYSFTSDEPVYNGILTIHSNIRSIYRQHPDFISDNWNNLPVGAVQISNIVGNNFRLTNELEWKKRINMDNGIILSPVLALRADVIATNTYKNRADHIINNSLLTIRKSSVRSMATAGLELRYPLLITSNNSTHTVEPIAQIFIRNNEHYIGQIPNEDAQSFVFDATTLFQRDKFSGYDRVEGGTRANIGMRYSGNLNNDWSLYGIIGQSFHLAGKNSFAEKDLINVSAYSGLEETRSDYVAMLSANHKNGFILTYRGRFDKKIRKIRRSEIEVSQKWQNFSAAVQYAYIQSQPSYKYAKKHQEISFQTDIKLSNYWSINSHAEYDLASGMFIKKGIILNYTNECFNLTLGYQQVTDLEKRKPSQNFSLSLSLRVVADNLKKIKSDL
ncbi:LPS-assembly protein LptD [Bartonella sp. B41]